MKLAARSKELMFSSVSGVRAVRLRHHFKIIGREDDIIFPLPCPNLRAARGFSGARHSTPQFLFCESIRHYSDRGLAAERLDNLLLHMQQKVVSLGSGFNERICSGNSLLGGEGDRNLHFHLNCRRSNFSCHTSQLADNIECDHYSNRALPTS